MGRTISRLVAFIGLLLFALPQLIAGDYFLYAYDSDSGQIRFYTLDKRSGMPLEHPLSPVAVTGGDPGCGGNCQTIAADPKREFLFVGTDTGLGVFRLERDGTPTEVSGSPFGGNTMLGVTAQRIGRYLGVAANDLTTMEVRLFEIDLISGAATDVGQFSASSGSDVPVGIWSTKKAVWSANQNQGAFYAYAIDRRNETLLPDPANPATVAGITDPFNLIANRRGDRLVLNDCASGGWGLVVLHKRSGTPLSSSRMASSSSCTEGIGWSRNGKIFYGMGEAGFDVIDAKRGQLTLVPFAFANAPDAGVMGPRGKHFYVSVNRDILHVTLDRRSKLPAVPPTTILVDTLTSEATGMVIVKK